MSISLSTLVIFLFLIPGVLFRTQLYFGSPVKRSIITNNIVYSLIAIIFYSIVIHFISLIVLSLLSQVAQALFDFSYELDMPTPATDLGIPGLAPDNLVVRFILTHTLAILV